MNFEDQLTAEIIEKKLAEIRATDMLPDELVALVEQVLPLQLAARAQARVELPTPEACASTEAMFAGSPMLLRQDFPHDLAQAASLFPRFLEILAGVSPEAAKAAEALREALATGELDPAQAMRALAVGDEALFATWREKLPTTPRALDFLATSSLWPGLNAAAQGLATRIPENLPHDHGHCPLCGSLPYISLLRGKEGQRHGVCSFCGHQYRVRRLGCLFCDETDQNKLKQFRVQEYPGVRVDVCESCSMYVKTLDFRELDRPLAPALDDMATIALDIVAQQQGYKRPTLSAWGF